MGNYFLVIKLNGKVKELIAIGASIGANCTPCLKHHLRLAKEYGASDQEIEEAIGIARQVRQNSTHSIDKLIDSTIKGESISEKTSCC